MKLASYKDARNRGVLVCHNDKIISATYVTKEHANNVDAFSGGDAGCLGRFDDDEINFFYEVARPLEWALPIAKLRVNELPKVDILYGHLEPDKLLFDAAIHNGAQGIVLAGMGAGCWETEAGKQIAEYAIEEEFPVVASRRTAHGYVGGTDIYGLECSCLAARYLNPSKCRIKLQVALACNIPFNDIVNIFESSCG